MSEQERKLYLDEIFRLRTQNAVLQFQVVCLQQQIVNLMQQQPQQQQQNHEVRQIQGGFKEVL